MHIGFLLLLFSAIFFSFTTVFVKLILNNSNIPAIELTFFRFFAGFLTMLIYILIKNKPFRPNNFKYISLRAISNSAAVIFFFLGIQYTTITKSNMLNMTYPIFVFLIAPFLNKEKIFKKHILLLLISLAGIYIVIIPNSGFSFSKINFGDIYSLISGIIAGFAISTLKEARKYDESYLILFYLMMVGSAISLSLIITNFVIPEGIIILYAALVALFSIIGQIFITVGYKYIDAAPGAIVSSSRILFALILGIIFFNDPHNLKIITGGILIILSLAGVSGIGKYLKQYLIKKYNL